MLISLKNIGFSYRYPLFEKISETLDLWTIMSRKINAFGNYWKYSKTIKWKNFF